MNSKPSLEKIRAELAQLQRREAVVYGSFCSGLTARSDIDVAVITRATSPAAQRRIWSSLLGTAPSRYDLKVFELLPLEVKMGVIRNYRVIFGNRLEVSEYFYHFRKLWEDSAHRYYENQFSDFREKQRALHRASSRESITR